MSATDVGILSAACFLPERTRGVEDIFFEEGVGLTDEVAARIGVDRVHVFEDPNTTLMAVEASRRALDKAGLSPLALDAVVDFSIMPQKYVEPAWSMSNELQAELGAKNAFTMGFSGGGASNLHVSLKFATALIRGDDRINTVLLASSDRAIPKNRVIGGDRPLTVLGDAGGAIIVQRGAPNGTLLGTSVRTVGKLHDVSYIPGGGIKHPTRVDLHKLTVDQDRLSGLDLFAAPTEMAEALLARHSLGKGDVKHLLYPNLSRGDQEAYAARLGAGSPVCAETRARHGHAQATDFVLNYLALQEAGIGKGEHVMMVSHGLGFTYGVSLIRF